MNGFVDHCELATGVARYKAARTTMLGAALLAAMLLGCADVSDAPPAERPAPAANRPATGRIEPAQARRLQSVMAPLVAKMNDPLPAREVKITLWSDPRINAANAGGGDFYVTTGLLQRANDDQLRAILAHEVAHADLGHVAKAQTLAAGLGIGTLILDQVLPGSGALAPIAGELVMRAHSRSEESAADAHAVTIMRRAGYDGKQLMAGALAWIARVEGGSEGGFFATHPATEDRIEAIRNLE
ncbi:MAG: M48 family metallopeptidase [Alphaproteobacteria bacterium]|nr:M48 family metallopeptidase [Alphaproteobacteria bacterium]